LRVPAVCNNCGTIFPSGFEAENARNITFSGCGAGPCPVCGGNGHIPDGVNNFIGNTIEFLTGPSRSANELQRLSDILRQAQKDKASTDEIVEKIEKEIPELSSIKDLLPKTRSDLYTFIIIILTIISMILTEVNQDKRPNIQIDQVVNVIYQQQKNTSKKLQTKSINETRKKKKIGRNEPCPCGSGKKYKKCCLQK
jgi:hypothetical protein